jgi:outer membrane protein TolC
VTTISYKLRRLHAAAGVLLVLAAAAVPLRRAHGQQADASPQAQTQADALPSAPSALIAQRNEALSKPPGSGYVFTGGGTQTGPHGIAVEAPAQDAIPLSLDDAISIAMQRNVRMRYDRANQKEVKGDTLGVLNALIPNLTFNAESSAQEIDLVAMGFKPSFIAGFAKTGLIPAGFQFANIVKVNTTQAMLNVNQVLFSLPDYELYRGTKNETRVVDLGELTDEGDVVLTVGSMYLKVLADESNVTNAEAQARSAKVLSEQAQLKLNAGVGTNLDALRGRVEYQQRAQGVLAAESTLEKDRIQLARILGLPAAQKVDLTDAAPFAELAEMDLDAAKITAYKHRKDLLSLEQQIALTEREQKAVKFQRLPTLAFNGFYGIIGLTTGPYHGDFSAAGSLNVPIFREAAQRGEQDVVNAQLISLRQREADLRVTIDSQIRASMLDVQAAKELVDVARSNVQLAQQELSDERDRFSAGVDDNLAVVDAESAVANAQSQMVGSLYQYNVAKLQLARNTGVVENRYRAYLGK